MSSFVIHANLDVEARWAGGALPGAIATRVSYYAALTAALAPADATRVEVWVPAAAMIDASRLVASPHWPGGTPPTLRGGTPPRADLAWAAPDAKVANDRRLAQRIGRELGASIPHANVVESVDAMIAWTAQLPDAASTTRWVAKAPWTSAGRDRCHGDGAPTDEQRTRLSRLLAKFGALVVEPWLDRVIDVGICARVAEYARGAGSAVRDEPFYVSIDEPHGVITDARGTFLGIDLAPPRLEATERTHLGVTARAVGARLAAVGFRGAFAIDAFAYRAPATSERRFHALCEINARHTFGSVARAFAARAVGDRPFTRLGFSAPPAGATMLIAPAGDGVTAWLA